MAELTDPRWKKKMLERSKAECMQNAKHYKLQQHEDSSHEDNQEREPVILENGPQVS